METGAATGTSRFCPMCAAPMRARAVFCHRCGRPVPEETAVVFKPKKSKKAKTNQNVAKLKTLEKAAENSIANNAPEIADQNGGFPAPFTNEEIAAANETADQQTADTVAAEESPAPPLPAPRRVVKTTEYVWEESAADPTWRFVLFAVVAVAFVLLVFWLARFIHF